jgi:hypothetical protein
MAVGVRISGYVVDAAGRAALERGEVVVAAQLLGGVLIGLFGMEDGGAFIFALVQWEGMLSISFARLWGGVGRCVHARVAALCAVTMWVR